MHEWIRRYSGAKGIKLSTTPASSPDGSIDAAMLRQYEGALRDFFGRRVRSREEVDDLVQEAFARLIASGNERDVQYPIAYLFRIASNLIHDHGRRRARRPGEQDLDSVGDELAVPPQQEDRRHLEDLRKRLDSVLASLSPKCRDVFIMRRFKNMTTPEIAGALGITHRMVQKHMARAMTSIYLELGENGSTREKNR